MPATPKSNGTVFYLTIFLENTVPTPLITRLQTEMATAISALPQSLVKEQTELFYQLEVHQKLDHLLHAFRKDTDLFNTNETTDAFFEFLAAHTTPNLNVIAFSVMSNHLHLCGSTNSPEVAQAVAEFINTCNTHLSESTSQFSTNNILTPLPDRTALSDQMQFIVNEPIERELAENPFDWRATFIREKYRNLLSQK